MSDENPPPEGPRTLDKETLLLTFESAISVLLGMRELVQRVVPDGFVVEIPEDGTCPHKNRAPSDPSFCLDCEQTVGGVSEGFTGGEPA